MSIAARRLQQHLQYFSPISGSQEHPEAMIPIFARKASPPAGPYSQAIQAAGQIFCSGQLPSDENGSLIQGSIAQKSEQCIKNIKAILEEGGSGLDKVVKVTVFLSDMKYFAEMNEEYQKWFTHKPARSCVAVLGLPKNVEVEFEAIAIM